MGKVIIEKTTYGNWGDCVKITNGVVDLVATLDFGPRIIRFGLVDGANEFFEDVNDEFNQNNNSEFDIFGDEGYWHIYGGHRLWTSPEVMPRSYYPDNEAVEFKITENGVILTPLPQAWNELQMQIEIAMSEDGEVTVTHRVMNIGAWEVEFAPWSLTVMEIGGLQIIPQPKKDTGLLGNRILALWPYTDMLDKRVVWDNDFIQLRPEKGAKNAFKFGINNEHGFAAYFNHGNLFVKKFNYDQNKTYPDGGVNYETYTNRAFMEMESIGELKIVKPDETVTHVETWKLHANVAEPKSKEEIEKVISQYI